MTKVEKSLLDTDIISEIIKRANPQIVAKADTYLNQFEKYTISVITGIPGTRKAQSLQC
jgi:tRNA(fMet)-specific endonuclease VapC